MRCSFRWIFFSILLSSQLVETLFKYAQRGPHFRNPSKEVIQSLSYFNWVFKILRVKVLEI